MLLFNKKDVELVKKFSKKVFLRRNVFHRIVTCCSEIFFLQRDSRWSELYVRARRIGEGMDRGATPFVLAQGAVQQAVENGHWLLVDEVII